MSDKISVIRHAPLSRFLVIYEDYLMLCKAKGIDPADAGAGILRVFEQWTNGKVNKNETEVERARQYASQGVAYEPEDLWVWLPQDTLKKHELFGIFGERSVASALKKIVEVGYLETRRNPKYGWDRTLQYRLNVTGLQADLDNMQKCGLPLPQSAVIEVANRGDGSTQSATSNTTVTSNESLQDNNSVAPTGATDSPPASDSEYDAFLSKVTTPATNQVKRPKGAMPNPNHADVLDAQPDEVSAPPEFDMLVTVISDKLKLFGGGAAVMARMLMGKSGRGDYNTYRMDEPVTATELGDWAQWYERNNPRLNKPTTPMKLQSSILEYRATATNAPQRPVPIVADDVLRPLTAAPTLLSALRGRS